ncbi:MAG: sensor histidine kinase [Sumerlaeia bacterium]
MQLKDTERIHQSARKALADSHEFILPATDDVLQAADWPKRSPLFRTVSVSKGLYVLLFMLITVLLSMGQVSIFHDKESGFYLFERMNASGLFASRPNTLGKNATDVSLELGLSYNEVATAERVLQRMHDVNAQRFLGPLDWGLNLRFGDYTIVFSYRIFLNMALATVISIALYSSARARQASDIIKTQNDNLRQLMDSLKMKIFEAERYLDELTKAQESLLQAQKLASIGRLSATLAHEIRNPMSIIKSAAAMAAEDEPEKSNTHEALSLIIQETQRLDAIISDLLDFARPKPASLSALDLNSSIRSWVHPLEEELQRHNIELILILEEKLPQIKADADQLYQVMLNLIWNARDALIASDSNRRGELRISTDTAGPNAITLCIRDNGPGMDEKTLEQITEPFFTTKTHGTGLGLPRVQQLVDGMRGSLIIESQPNKGTTVTIVLKAYQPNAIGVERLPSSQDWMSSLEPSEEDLALPKK